MSLGSLHNTMRPLGLLSLIACLLVATLSGCGTPPTPVLEPVTIAFAYPGVDEGYYEELIVDFTEEHPHITVEPRPTPWNALDDLGAGDADVFVTTPLVLTTLQAQGEVLNLDPFVEQDGSLDLPDFYPGTVELLTVEGKEFAVPAGADVVVMFYSKDLFDQHGLPYPEIGWTWDDFLVSALAISDPDAGIFGYTTTGPTTSPSYFDAALFVYQHGGRLFDSLQDPAGTTFDDPLTVEALEWYAMLYDEYEVAPTPREARSAFGGGQYAIFDGLRHGRVGMWMGNLSDRGGLTWPVEWFVDWGMAPLPRDVESITQAEVEGYAISAQTGYPDACWQWIVFLSRQIPERLMPARRSLAESSAYGKLVGEEIAAVARASMESAVLINLGAFVEFEGAMDAFADAVGDVIDGEATSREALSEAQRRAER